MKPLISRKQAIATQALIVLFAGLALFGCSSSGTSGLVTKNSVDSATLLKAGASYKELGPVEATSCLNIGPLGVSWGDSDFSLVVDKALAEVGGDALVNVTTSSGSYGYLPIFTLHAWTCTTVQGIAIKFE
jgi:hypothetical protein